MNFMLQATVSGVSIGTVEADDDDRRNFYIIFEMVESNLSVSSYYLYSNVH